MWLWFTTQAAGLRHFSFRAFLASLLGAFGVLWLAVEVGSFFLPKFAEAIPEYWWVFAGTGAVAGLWRARPRLVTRARIAGTDASIEIRVCNLFSQAGALVLGSNTTFDTATEDGTISDASTQGQFTRQFCASLDNLDRQISDSLSGIGFKELSISAKPYGKRRIYPVGTVASVTCNGKRAYFVAIATLNSYRVALATTQEVLDALPQLWESVRSRGGMDPISTPVLGSGFARVGAKREELIREIVKSFVAATQAGRFCEKLTIAVAPQDYRGAHVDLQSLGRFLEHECTYARGHNAVPSTPLGTPAEP